MENQPQLAPLGTKSSLILKLMGIPLKYWIIFIVFVLVSLNIFTPAKSKILQLNTSNTVNVDNITSTTSKLLESKLFCITQPLIVNNYYQIRTEYLGSKGFAIAIFWKHDQEQMNDFLSNY